MYLLTIGTLFFDLGGSDLEAMEDTAIRGYKT